MIEAFVRRMTSRAFWKFFGIMLIAELITMGVAWLLLGANTQRWINEKAIRALHIAQEVASSRDWSLIDRVPIDRDTDLGTTYGKLLNALDDRYFSHLEGGIYLVTIKNGEEYDLSADDTSMSDTTKANPTEVESYEKRTATYSPTPIVDDWGTYLAGYVPIFRDGKVLGLVATEIDSASLTDFQSVIQSVFLKSIVPAILISLIVAYLLATMFVEPAQVLRSIEETAQKLKSRSPEEEQSDPWLLLSDRDKEMAELLRQGVERTKDIADAMGLTPATIDTYFKQIKAKTGYSRLTLAVQAAARRSAAAEASR